MAANAELRKHLRDLLTAGQAHLTNDQVLDDFPVEYAGVRPEGLPHSAWELLEHMRIAQHDILLFSRSREEYVELAWPDDYWPRSPAPANRSGWDASVKAFRADLTAMLDLIADPARDLYAPFPWGTGQTLLREALLVADHNAYHLGQLVLVNRLVSGHRNHR